jgi:hypothetical protein
MGKPRPSPSDHETVAAPSLRSAVTDVGGNGARPSTIEADVAANEVPTVFVDVRAKVYGIPLVKPVIVHVSVTALTAQN